MAKSITARDMVVIKVIMALMPDVAELTITRYENVEWDAKKYVVARIKIAKNHLSLKLLKTRGQWCALFLDVPPPGPYSSLPSGGYRIGQNPEGYVLYKQ